MNSAPRPRRDLPPLLGDHQSDARPVGARSSRTSRTARFAAGRCASPMPPATGKSPNSGSNPPIERRTVAHLCESRRHVQTAAHLVSARGVAGWSRDHLPGTLPQHPLARAAVRRHLSRSPPTTARSPALTWRRSTARALQAHRSILRARGAALQPAHRRTREDAAQAGTAGAPAAARADAGMLATAMWSLRASILGLASQRPRRRNREDIRMFVLFHDPALTRRCRIRSASPKGLIGVVYAFATPIDGRRRTTSSWRMNCCTRWAPPTSTIRKRRASLSRRLRRSAAGAAVSAVVRGIDGGPAHAFGHPMGAAGEPGRGRDRTRHCARNPLAAARRLNAAAALLSSLQPSACSTAACIAPLVASTEFESQRDGRSAKVREAAAGLGHDRDARGDVEDIHVRFDHRVDLAGREQVVVQEIAVAADAIHPRHELAIARPLPPGRQRFHVARRQRRRLERRHLADRDAPCRSDTRRGRARHTRVRRRPARSTRRGRFHRRASARFAWKTSGIRARTPWCRRSDRPATGSRRPRRAIRFPRRRIHGSGKRDSRISRIAISQRTSASVTGDLSALMRTSMLCWYSERAMTAGLLRRVERGLEFREGFIDARRFHGFAPP